MVERTADMKYKGQAHDISVELPDGEFDEDDLDTIKERFNRTYADTYGYSDSDEPIEGVTWKVTVRSVADSPELHAEATSEEGDPYKGTREAYFERASGFVECDVYDRMRLAPDTEFTGPAVVEERNSTSVVPPGDEVTVDEYGNLVISIQE